MFNFFRSFNNLSTNTHRIVVCVFRNFKYTAGTRELNLRKQKRIEPLGWFLLLIPTSTFALGTWQVQRKKWKENLIDALKSHTDSDPVALPESLHEVENLEYCPIHVRGEFLHDKEIHIGPRALIKEGEVPAGSLFSKGQSNSNGYLVVTPFRLKDRDVTILVNRGWVPHKNKDPRTRPAGQVAGEVNVIGILRAHENRPPFMPSNKPEVNMWFYRDLSDMCKVTGADPIFIDATTDFDVDGGPTGGQTRITLRNEHLSYILTWYSLSAVSSLMWYAKFVKGVSF